jgi:hypothetical protein
MTNYKLKKQKTSGVWAKDLPEDVTTWFLFFLNA